MTYFAYVVWAIIWLELLGILSGDTENMINEDIDTRYREHTGISYVGWCVITGGL